MGAVKAACRCPRCDGHGATIHNDSPMRNPEREYEIPCTWCDGKGFTAPPKPVVFTPRPLKPGEVEADLPF